MFTPAIRATFFSCDKDSPDRQIPYKKRDESLKYRRILPFSSDIPMVCFGAAVALAGIIGISLSRSTA
tara:strand:- start:1710 stop:1913 length:204 start_codon:yes stop_codon:yes gene_type:complete